MKVAIDIAPLTDKRTLGHKVRGSGYYLENLKNKLVDNFGEDNFTFFSKGDNLTSDVDLIHYPYFEPFFITLPLRFKKKTVVTVHDLTPLVFSEDFPAGLKGKVKWQIQRGSLKNTNAIITDSHSSRKDILKFVGVDSNKVHVIYLAASEQYKKINSESELQSTKEKFGLPDKFVLYVGDVTRNKNLVNLLNAASGLGIPIVMVGKALVEENYDKDNPWNKDLVEVQELAKKNSNIIRLGFVPDKDLVLLYNCATLLAMPSLYEGFGLPVLEAMQSGCPVVISKSGSLSEIGGEAAQYVDPGSVESIANGIKNVFNNEGLRRELIEKGLRQSRKFSWDKTAKETYNIYKEIIDSG